MLEYVSPGSIGMDAAQLQRAYDLATAWTTAEGAEPAIMPAAAIMVGRNGKAVEPKFFGRQGTGKDAPPIRRDALFLIASLTKPITYLGAMILVERGLLGLSDPVTKYIPDFAAHHKENTLVQHLFTHTSGLPDMLENNTELRRQHAPLSKFIDGAIRDTVPKFPAGTDYSYQSMGTLVVAEIVQRISGLSISDFLQKEIFTPLGLKSSALGVRDLNRERLTQLQTPEFAGVEQFGWNSPYWRELGAPWGGMFSTPDDYAVLCQLMLNGGSYGNVRIVSSATVEKMTTNRLNDFPDLPEPIRRTKPWGLGWQLNHPATEGTLGDLLPSAAYGHLGATGTLFWIDPQRQAFCIIFTTMERDRAPWRLVHLSNAVAAAME
ncbi:Penicillin-binding protein 4* [Anatilimnocola aggregata]|uniref:Penicillin-binding protein 4 n=1 Tax=Anatilimnocola aggregata TaxID=2528021 RepID=A0A517YNZ8_9BACT|nr:serine hydrolase domain-containing protein [Anatilimnocola aggregata]QDU31942.1 Penicillin-binding protein 4* [Anatilimnocola aggregata]